MNKTLTRSALCVAVLALASLAAMAQNTPGFTTINGGKQTVAMKPGAITPGAPNSDALKTVYSNLGTGTSVYNCCSGWTISAVGSIIGAQNWVANGFTPTKSYSLAKIQVGVGYVTGTNGVNVALAKDKGGIPGTIIKSWNLTTLPTFGSCCTLMTAKVSTKKPIKVSKGKQYWVIVATDKKTPDTWDAWNLDTSGATGNFANNTGSGWVNQGTAQQGAFGVFAH